MTYFQRFSFFQASLLATCGLCSFSIFAADLYVSPSGNDSNSGAQAAPLKTIQRAANLATAGTTVHVAPGNYQEQITSKNSGTASARIKYVSDVKWKARLLPVSGVTSMWEIPGGYTDVIGFEIDGSGSNTLRIGVAFSGGNSSMQNSRVHDVAMNTVCDNIGGAGVHATQARGASYNNYDFLNNIIYRVGGTCGYISAIYHQSSGKIQNNLIYASSYAIHGYHDDHNLLIANNTVFGNSGYGILYGGCQEAYNNGCPTSGMRIYNNIIYDNGGGISGPVTAADVDNILKNNLVYKNANQFDLASPSNSTRSGEVMADPQFVNYIRTGGGDYHLKSTSPAINKGLVSLSPSVAPSTDLDGNPRLDGAPDLGAYEYGTAPVPSSAVLSLSSRSLVFGNQNVGTTSVAQTVTLKNVGTAPLILGSAWTLTGDFQFASGGTCGSTPMVPGESCVINLAFKPTAATVRTGSLILTSNDAKSPAVISLSGTGVVSAPVASPSTRSLSFGTVRLGRSSSIQYVTVKNTGTSVLNFGNVSISGDFQWGNAGTCDATLAVGASCTFSAKFVPKATGARTGVMSISSNDPVSPLKIQLTGTGSR
ncbi:MAG: choice-of-anchor D domain-containing protein [Bdellovibrionia bacterium]